MAKSLLERRLIDVSDRLKRLRAEFAVAEEQCAFLTAEAEDARLRSLVSETPLAEAEAHEMRRHADAQTRQRDALRRSITELEREQDALLDRMAHELPSPRLHS
jgi:chromosome segregation ATPase